jgi:hypothetical protein
MITNSLVSFSLTTLTPHQPPTITKLPLMPGSNNSPRLFLNISTLSHHLVLLVPAHSPISSFLPILSLSSQCTFPPFLPFPTHSIIHVCVSRPSRVVRGWEEFHHPRRVTSITRPITRPPSVPFDVGTMQKKSCRVYKPFRTHCIK